MNKKKLITINVVLVLAIISIGIKEAYHKTLYHLIFPQSISENEYDTTLEHKHETELYKVYNKKANIVMLGNSITYRANWNELLNRNDIINRGIGRDITNGMRNRLESVINVDPKICFVMGGINDILNGIDSKKILLNIEAITNTLNSNTIKPIVLSILYTSKTYKNYAVINSKVFNTNKLIQQFCKKNNIVFINLNQSLSTNKILKDEFDFDGLHLNAAGYNKLKQIITPIINQKLE